MPDLLKIGYTEQNVEEMVSELNSTGVPDPFEIEAVFESTDPFRHEQDIYKTLDQNRLVNSAEFFYIDIKHAMQISVACIGLEPSYLKSPEPRRSKSENEGC